MGDGTDGIVNVVSLRLLKCRLENERLDHPIGRTSMDHRSTEWQNDLKEQVHQTSHTREAKDLAVIEHQNCARGVFREVQKTQSAVMHGGDLEVIGWQSLFNRVVKVF